MYVSTHSSLPEMEIFRMVPPGVHYFAFSINGSALKYDSTVNSVTKETALAASPSFKLPLNEQGNPDESLLPERFLFLSSEMFLHTRTHTHTIYVYI